MKNWVLCLMLGLPLLGSSCQSDCERATSALSCGVNSSFDARVACLFFESGKSKCNVDAAALSDALEKVRKCGAKQDICAIADETKQKQERDACLKPIYSLLEPRMKTSADCAKGVAVAISIPSLCNGKAADKGSCEQALSASCSEGDLGAFLCKRVQAKPSWGLDEIDKLILPTCSATPSVSAVCGQALVSQGFSQP